LFAFVAILGGAFVGALLRKALPDDHLADDAKDIIRLGAGLVASLARPGGNTTGFTAYEYGLSVKWLFLLYRDKEADGSFRKRALDASIECIDTDLHSIMQLGMQIEPIEQRARRHVEGIGNFRHHCTALTHESGKLRHVISIVLGRLTSMFMLALFVLDHDSYCPPAYEGCAKRSG